MLKLPLTIIGGLFQIDAEEDLRGVLRCLHGGVWDALTAPRQVTPIQEARGVGGRDGVG